MTRHQVWQVKRRGDAELEYAPELARPVVPQLLSEHHLCVVLRGTAEVRYRGERYCLPRAACQVFQAGETLSCRPNRGGGWGHATLRLSPALVHEVARDLGYSDPPAFAATPPPAAVSKLSKLFEDLLAESTPSGAAPGDVIRQVIGELLAHPSPETRRATLSPRAQHAVASVKNHLEANVGARVPLEQLAELCSMSKYHLVKLFGQVVGVPPYTYQLCLRLRAAKYLLRSQAPIPAVAFDLGFADQAHFTRTFKRYLGMTPGYYRTLAAPPSAQKLPRQPALSG